MPSPILARADALMQRRRQSAEGDDVPVLTDTVDLALPDSDDDVPVLLDIEPIEPLTVTPETAAPSEADTLPEAPRILLDEPPLPELLETVTAQEPLPGLPAALSTDVIAREIAHRVKQRLSAELPRIIESTVRDFLTEQAATVRRKGDTQG